jgi:hypothetical protein
MEPAPGDPLAGDRVGPADMGGLDQPLAGHRMAAGGQPLERHPVQPVQAEPGPQPPVELWGCLARGAVGSQVVVGLLAATLEITPQVSANPSDQLGLELPGREHHDTAGSSRS